MSEASICVVKASSWTDAIVRRQKAALHDQFPVTHMCKCEQAFIPGTAFAFDEEGMLHVVPCS
jgi:hypothetical protein